MKLIIFFILLSTIFNGCLYSCNYAPDDKLRVTSTDTCDPEGNSQLLRFQSIAGSGGKLTIAMVMLLPCKTEGTSSEVFSLAFYNADSLIEPQDLMSLKFSWNNNPLSLDNPKCPTGEGVEKSIKKIEADPNFKALSLGSAISFAVGYVYTNRLYPFGIKIPYTNDIYKTECKPQGLDMSPFVQGSESYSPVYQGSNNILSEANRINPLFTTGNNKIISMYAPFFTMGTKLMPEGSDQGLRSTKGLTGDGSFFNFDVRLKPGRYYVVFSHVPNPTANAMKGNFSLDDVKVYNEDATNFYKKYIKDCGKTVACGTPITVS